MLAGLHVPAPSHVRPSVCVVPTAGHDGGAHDVPAGKRSQAPLPSQKPVVPQLAGPAFTHELVGSTPPAGTGVHVPAVTASAHDRHVPAHAVLQHAPCAQKPEPHSVFSAQAAPGALRPHSPPVQTAGASQSPSPAQVALQAAAPQVNGKHDVAAGVTQAPAPSHVAPGVKVVLDVGQLGPAHGVPWAYFWQAPAAHIPFVPQVEAFPATHVPAGSLAPVATSAQMPMAPVSAHERHASAQAVAQQTPCAQKPEPHSDLSEQKAPLLLGPHELCASQTLGTTQAVLVAHAVKQRAPLQAYGAQAMVAGATHWPVLLQVEVGV